MQTNTLQLLGSGLLASLLLHVGAPAFAQAGPGAPGFGSPGPGAGGVADDFGAAVDAIFPVIDFTDLLPPPAGNSYVDPIFGSVIKRVSDARATPDNAVGGMLTAVNHEYSTIAPFNADNTRLLLLHFSYFALYDGTGNYLRDLPFDVAASSEPRWSRSDPDVFYYLVDNEVRSYDIGSDARKTLRTFNEYQRVSGMGEAELSADGQNLVLVGDDREVFVYNIPGNVKGPVLRLTSPGTIDNVFMTPDNNVLVGWYAKGTSRFNGLELFDRNMNFLRQIFPVLGHMDIGRDSNGDEIALIHNSGHPSPPVNCLNAVVKVRLRDRRQTCLLPFDWGIGVHISAPLEGDWFIVSTYSQNDPSLPPPGSGMRYRDEILRVRLDGSRVERLAHHWSRAYDSYSFQPKASISNDGSRLVFSSNYRRQEKGDVPDTYTDAFLLCIECEAERSDSRWVRNETFQVNLLREEETVANAEFEGPWHGMHHTLLSNEGVKVSSEPGASVSYTFQGPVVGWVGYKGPMAGVAEVFIDGESHGIVDGFQAKHAMQAYLFTARDLDAGEHVLTIEVREPPAERVGKGWVWVDAFDTRPFTPTEADLRR